MPDRRQVKRAKKLARGGKTSAAAKPLVSTLKKGKRTRGRLSDPDLPWAAYA